MNDIGIRQIKWVCDNFDKKWYCSTPLIILVINFKSLKLKKEIYIL